MLPFDEKKFKLRSSSICSNALYQKKFIRSTFKVQIGYFMIKKTTMKRPDWVFEIVFHADIVKGVRSARILLNFPFFYTDVVSLIGFCQTDNKP